MRITEQQMALLVAQARAAHPNECCGLIGCRDNRVTAIVAMTNTEASPQRYRLDPPELLRALDTFEAQGLRLGAIYHSHPQGVAYPSTTDIELALQPAYLYVIIGLANPQQPELRAFRIVAGRVTEQALAITN